MITVTSFSDLLAGCVCEAPAEYAGELEQHYDAVLEYLDSLCHEAELAQDLTQETYLRAYAHLDRHGTQVERPLPWLLRIARCAFIDHVRYMAVRPSVRVDPLEVVEDPAGSCIAEAVVTAEERARLVQAIEGLSPLNQALLIGFHIAGQTVADLARRHSLSPGAARVRVFRARRELRRHLS